MLDGEKGDDVLASFGLTEEDAKKYDVVKQSLVITLISEFM